MRTTTAHGYTILERKASAHAPSEIVLAHLPHNSFTPYVVWRMDRDSGICEGGDYRSTLAEANSSFARRA